MNINDWADGFPSAITVCDKDGTILYMNEKSAKTFEEDGGKMLIGSNVLDCHPEPSRTKLEGMLKEERVNTYTIDKKGKKKLIHQSPYYVDGVYAGFVELSIELPENMPNFVRG